MKGLIHKKHTHHKTDYYKEFIKNKIIIGKTNFNEPTNEPISVIFDDDMCPSCNTIGYVTQHNQINPCDNPPDCYKCFINICKICANYDKKKKLIFAINVKILLWLHQLKIKLMDIKDKINLNLV